MHLKYLLVVLLSFAVSTAYSQEDEHYFIPEVSVGSIVPNYRNGPECGLKIGANITYYKSGLSETPTHQYYHYPLLGIQAGFYRLGNAQVYGNEISLMPVMGLRMKKGMFQWGIGTSYHTKSYLENERNQSVGSHWNWAFQWMYFRSFKITENKNLRIGFGYRHSSNGHTQLPNYGLNSALISFALTPADLKMSMQKRAKIPKSRTLFILARTGVGIHEFGSTTSPVGGKKKLVFTQSIAAGFTFKGHFRWYAGLGTRKYQHFADSINSSPELQALAVKPTNHYFLMGIEYLVQHVGISIEGGINLYKPFYYHFSKKFENTESIKYTLKKLFPSRMGLKLYLINTDQKPKHNVYFSAHINANFGQADFSEASLGYVYNL